MATLQELQDALVKANDAGDDEHAQLFADEIKKLQTSNPDADHRKQVLDNYNNSPWYQKPLTAADDVVRLMGDGLSFGHMDKAAAGLNSLIGGTKYDDELVKERQATQDAETRAGLASVPAELMGGVLTGDAAARMGLTLGGRLTTAASPLLTRLGASALTNSVEGAGYGALSAAGHDKDVKEGALSGAETGAVLGPALEGTMSALGGIWSRLRGVNAAPSAAALQAAKDAAYRQMEQSGTRYTPQAMRQMMTDMISNVVRNPAGARQATAPKALDKVAQIADTATPVLPGTRSRPGASVSLYDLDELRKSVVRDVLNDSSGAEQHWGGAIRDSMDRAMADTDPSRVTASIGTPQEAVDALMHARELNRRASNVDDMQKILTDAQRRSDASANGMGPGDRIRGKIASVLESDKKSRFLNPDEQAQLEDVVRGTTTGNLARTIGAFTHSWPGRAAASSAGAMVGGTLMGGPIGAAVGATGGMLGSELVRKLANHVAETSVEGGIRDVMNSMARGRRTIPYRNSAPLSTQQTDDMLRRLLILQAQRESSQSN